MNEDDQNTMPRLVAAAEVSDRWKSNGQILQIDSVVGVLQIEGGEIGKHVEEDLVWKLEYCEGGSTWLLIVCWIRMTVGCVTWAGLGYRFALDPFTSRQPP